LKTGWAMETIVQVIAIVSFLYMLLWGRQSLAEILKKRRKSREDARLCASAARRPQVFLSYSRRDLKFVERLAWDLKAAGLEVWYDLSGLKVGARWGKEIQKAIRESRYFVAILSPNSVSSEWVEREFLFARQLKVKIIPILHAACILPIWAIDMQYIDIQGTKYRENLVELLRELGVVPVEPPVKPPAPIPVAKPPPEIIVEHPKPSRPRTRDGQSAARLLAKLQTPQVARASGLAIAAGGLVVLALFVSSKWSPPPVFPAAALASSTVAPGATRSPTAPPSEATALPTATAKDADTLAPIFADALERIKAEAPIYKTDFSSLDGWYPPTSRGTASIEDGVAILTSSDPNGLGASLGAKVLASDMFGVVLDVRREGYHGRCGFFAENENVGSSDARAFRLWLWENGTLSVGHAIGTFEPAEKIAWARRWYDLEKWTTVTALVLGKDIAVLVNDELVLDVIDPQGGATYTAHSFLATGEANVCEFDNFRIWDLRVLKP
jgi:hypothetical protein